MNIWGGITDSMTLLYEDVLVRQVILIQSSAKVGMYKGKFLDFSHDIRIVYVIKTTFS